MRSNRYCPPILSNIVPDTKNNSYILYLTLIMYKIYNRMYGTIGIPFIIPKITKYYICHEILNSKFNERKKNPGIISLFYFFFYFNIFIRIFYFILLYFTLFKYFLIYASLFYFVLFFSNILDSILFYFTLLFYFRIP